MTQAANTTDRSPDPRADAVLAALPGYALRRAASAMMAQLGARLAPLGLRVTDAAVLVLIADRRDMTSSEIGRILEIQRANMVPLLARLDQARLIRREPIDRKSQAIVLTPLGHETRGQARTVMDAFERELLDRIPAEHRAHFLPALIALLD